MDFSSGIIIDFGLNLAGYVIVTLLVYALTFMGRKNKVVSPAIAASNIPVAPARVSMPEMVRHSTAMEPAFVSFGGDRRAGRVDAVVGRPKASAPAPQFNSEAGSRQDNRRAIYREARQLLARGKSQSELLARLPLTEDEIEMLSIAGNA